MMEKQVRYLIGTLFFLIVSFSGLIYVVNYLLVQTEEQERKGFEVWAKAYEKITDLKALDEDITFPFYIVSNNDLPVILTDGDGKIISSQHIDTSRSHTLQAQLEKMQAETDPIIISDPKGMRQYIYYQRPIFVRLIPYFPLVVLGLFIIFLIIIYFQWSALVNTSQKAMWVSMSKETAHQIGTPLSSLMGWVAFLKTEHRNDDIASEMEQDLERLKIITERFSKIGSPPKPQTIDIVALTRSNIDYLKDRLPKRIQISFETNTDSAFINLNKYLYGWVIENMLKNAVDALKGEGAISVRVEELTSAIELCITDQGVGIPRRNWKRVFRTGFTTKQRGWGMGLSLCRRIVQDYCKGKIFVRTSEVGVGTTFCIVLNKVE